LPLLFQFYSIYTLKKKLYTYIKIFVDTAVSSLTDPQLPHFGTSANRYWSTGHSAAGLPPYDVIMRSTTGNVVSNSDINGEAGNNSSLENMTWTEETS
jgi:hypothetical protein